MKKILLKEREIEYELKISNRARAMRLSVYADARFVVTSPKHINEKEIEKFIIKKSDWVIQKIDEAKNNPKIKLSPGGKKDFQEHKETAKSLAESRLTYFNKFYNLKWNNISIKNTKTRWGSCSKKGNLNFNYKIALLKPELADYIIVHELCHLKEFNHSKKFWNLVALTIPNYLELRKQIKNIF